MKCPTCEKPFSPPESSALPFCSERCRQVDLGRWLNEAYSVPQIPDPDDPEAIEEALFSEENDYS